MTCLSYSDNLSNILSDENNPKNGHDTDKFLDGVDGLVTNMLCG